MGKLAEKFTGILKPLTSKLGSSKLKYGDYEASKVGNENEVVITNWNSDEGKIMLFRSNYNHAFFRLAHVYQPQINPFYAGVACSVATLNALRVEKGTIPNQEGFDYIDHDGKEYHYNLYSQLTLLNEKTDRVKKKNEIAPSLLEENKRPPSTFNPGLTLYQVMHILQVYDAEVEVHYADEEDRSRIDLFTSDLKETLNDPNKVLLANFDGDIIGLASGGHFSVVGAFDENSNSVLVLDTAAHRNPWYWVPVEHLYHAMHTMHGEKYRGYLIVSDNESQS